MSKMSNLPNTWKVNDPNERVKNAAVATAMVAGIAAGLLVLFVSTLPAWTSALVGLAMTCLCLIVAVCTDGPDRDTDGRVGR